MPNSTDLYEEYPEVFLPMFEQWEDRADDQVDGILTQLEEAYDLTPASVLDVGCGTGRHVISFAERGIEAHGLDISPEYIERAEDRATSAGVSDLTSFFARDMRELEALSQTYDLLTCVYTSFGYFDEETNAALLEAFADRLNPRGILLVEVPNKEGFLTAWSGGSVSKPHEDAVHAERHEYDPLPSRTTVTIFAIENETYLGEGEFEARLYTPIELRKLFDSAGFNDIHLSDGFNGGELTRDSTRLLVMGRT